MVSGGLPSSEERKRTKIRSDELWINGRTKIRSASKERKTLKIRKIHKIGWISEFQRMEKKPRFISSANL
ncbi:unnamed protein product [Rhizophagus irregularis]|nr:unnamed protein product [Rhizophagus irregularis]